MKRIAMLLAFFVYIGLQCSMAQTVQITGLITSSEDKQPLIGATVLVKGTTIGVNTDVDGKYTIQAPTNATTLVISYVGMKTYEVAIAGKNVINAELKSESIGLEEVVVTSLAISKSQKSVGYAVTTVNSDEIAKAGQSSLMNSLEGKIAGVTVSTSGGTPGASTKVTLRGYSSITGTNNPLYIVDGQPIDNTDYLQNGVDFGNGANDLNPDDIESISIMKGASANVLYGSRAANGAIIITTKKGKASDRIHAEFSSNTSITNPVRLPQMQNSFGVGWNAIFDPTQNGSWGPAFNGTLQPWGSAINGVQQIRPYSSLPTNLEDFYITGTQYNNSLSLSGGTDIATFYVSYNNTTENGMLPGGNNYVKRNTFTARGEVKIHGITFSASANYVHRAGANPPDGTGHNNTAASIYQDILQMPRNISIVDQQNWQGANSYANNNNYFTPYAYNPYYDLSQIVNYFTENRFYGNIAATFEIVKDLKATIRVGEDFTDVFNQNDEAVLSFTPGSYSALGDKNIDHGYYGIGFTDHNEFNSDFILSYLKKVNSSLSLNAYVGYNINERTEDQEFDYISSLNIPGFYNIQNSSSAPIDQSFISDRRLCGLYGDIDLSFKEYWFVGMDYRRDWSSTLPVNADHYDYYGINTSFLLTEALPILKNNVFSFGKLTLSYGVSGNDASPYQINSVFTHAGVQAGANPNNIFNFPLLGVNGFMQGQQIGNPTLQPEITNEFEAGTDLRFFENRIKFDFTYYNRISSKQILPVPIAPSSGYTSQIMNFGSVTNVGEEIHLAVIPVKSRDWEWLIDLTYNHIHNNVKSLAPNLNQVIINNAYQNLINMVAIVGHPVGTIQGPIPEYSPSGQIIVNPLTGMPVASPTYGNYGDVNPRYTMGLSSSLTWKSLNFGFAFDIREGGVMYSATSLFQNFTGNGVSTLYNNREPWIIPNSVVESTHNGTTYYTPNTNPITFENVVNYYYFTTNEVSARTAIIDRSYVKLRSANLDYTIPKIIYHKTPITSASIGLYGKNLLLWTPRSNTYIDPETSSFGNDLAGDFGEQTAGPTARQVGLSIKIQF